MSGQTIAEKLLETKTRLAAYLAAEVKILTHNQSYSIGDRSFSRADLAEIKSTIKQLQKDCDRLESGSQGLSVVYGLPRST